MIQRSDWPRVTALFDEAAALDSAAREQLLAREEAASPAVVAEVRAMLRSHDTAGDFLDEPVWAADPELLLEPSVDALIGRRIGPYRVLEQIGRGGMGVVYAAEDERLGRTVALKALPPSYRGDSHARERLSREARAAARLSHPSIATVYALEEFDGNLFIASELVHGHNLRTTLASGAVPRERLFGTLIQIAEALEAAHQHGIVHRDLKPENVLCTAEGRIKVVDFGIARHVTSVSATQTGLTADGMQPGTLGYMAPEQLRGRPVDARADVFAFGVMSYELATGVHPFGGGDPAALLERFVSDDPPLWKRIELPGLDAVIRKCLQGEPSARYASGTELVGALQRLQSVPAAAPVAPSPSMEGAWWWKFHQVAVAALTIIAVATIWQRKDWLAPYGSAAFIISLVFGTITTTLRLHMWFVSQVHPASLLALRTRVLRAVVICESILVAGLLAMGIHLTGPHDGTAAELVIIALLLLLSLLVIEPATTRASLKDT